MNQAAVRRIFVVAFVLLPTLIVMALLHRQQVAVSATSQSVVPTITFPTNPTPWPTVDMRHVTPVPTLSAPPTEPPITLPTEEIINPSDPFYLIINGNRTPNTRVSVNDSSAIVIGQVEEIFPARWSTPDGQRPADPFAYDNQATIYTPVRIQVEQSFLGYTTGEQMVVYALGGMVGQDAVVYASDDTYKFQLGDRVVVFVEELGAEIDGNPQLQVRERYSISSEGLAYNGLRQVPLQELVQEIEASLASPLPVVTSIPAPAQ